MYLNGTYAPLWGVDLKPEHFEKSGLDLVESRKTSSFFVEDEENCGCKTS